MTVKAIGDKDLANLMEEVEREFRPHHNVSQLGCPHILEAYGKSWRERSTLPHLGYIYMEYAPYRDLHDIIPWINDETG